MIRACINGLLILLEAFLSNVYKSFMCSNYCVTGWSNGSVSDILPVECLYFAGLIFVLTNRHCVFGSHVDRNEYFLLIAYLLACWRFPLLDDLGTVSEECKNFIKQQCQTCPPYFATFANIPLRFHCAATFPSSPWLAQHRPGLDHVAVVYQHCASQLVRQ
ncbi:hypothetical protein LZ32DRAFT_163930 [Colletotrichum eremochloae]|nr:hypothetical protein LZ32DRAFT_163930 [Colletotrichum eremochloae]